MRAVAARLETQIARANFDAAMIDLERIKWQGPEALSPGKHTIEFDFKYDGLGAGTLAFNSMSGLGRSGTGTLKVDGNFIPNPMVVTDKWIENGQIVGLVSYTDIVLKSVMLQS